MAAEGVEVGGCRWIAGDRVCEVATCAVAREKEPPFRDVQLESATDDGHHLLDEGFIVHNRVIYMAAPPRVPTSACAVPVSSPTQRKNRYPTKLGSVASVVPRIPNAEVVIIKTVQPDNEPLLLYVCVWVGDIDGVCAVQRVNNNVVLGQAWRQKLQAPPLWHLPQNMEVPPRHTRSDPVLG